MLAAMENLDVPLRIHRHTSGLDEILAWRELKEVREQLVVEPWASFLASAGKSRS